MEGLTLTLPIRPGSDGDSTHLPTGANYRLVDPPTIYLDKLGTAWAQRAAANIQPGVKYTLDKLPDGYAVWERPRPGNPNVIDKWLFGHPKHKWFDSPNRFLPHFLHLMEHGNSNGCNCSVCSKPGAGSRQTGRPSGVRSFPSAMQPTTNGSAMVSRPKGRPVGKVDDEGNPDVYRTLIDRLQSSKTLDVPITETMSMDWRTEKSHLDAWFKKVSAQPAWIPRNGEVVLFVRKLPENQTIQCDEKTGHFQIWDSSEEDWRGFPQWEAGLITQTPMEDVHIEELLTAAQKNYAVSYSGFRVEPVPDPNSNYKPFSKQYTYVPLCQIRPLNFWSEYLAGTTKDTWHLTVQHVHTAAATVSLVDKYHFKGTWPSARISCRGMFIGPEFVTEGDFVRLLPLKETNNTVTDILKITSIALDLSRLDTSSGNDYDDGHPYNSTIHVTGKLFTLDKARAIGPEVVDPELLPEDYEAYGKWYYTHDLRKSARIPFHRILSRCYEPAAMGPWFPKDDNTPNLSLGLRGLRSSRLYSAKIDRRIKDGKKWYWADCRAEGLDLHEINGLDVASRDPDRDTKQWRKEIRIIEGLARPEEIQAVQAAAVAAVTSRGLASQTGMFKSAINLTTGGAEQGNTSAEGSRDRKRSRSAAMGSQSDSSEEDDAGIDQADFVAQMAEGIGLPMDDEMVSDEDDDDEDNHDVNEETPRGRKLEVVIE